MPLIRGAFRMVRGISRRSGWERVKARIGGCLGLISDILSYSLYYFIFSKEKNNCLGSETIAQTSMGNFPNFSFWYIDLFLLLLHILYIKKKNRKLPGLQGDFKKKFWVRKVDPYYKNFSQSGRQHGQILYIWKSRRMRAMLTYIGNKFAYHHSGNCPCSGEVGQIS